MNNTHSCRLRLRNEIWIHLVSVPIKKDILNRGFVGLFRYTIKIEPRWKTSIVRRTAILSGARRSTPERRFAFFIIIGIARHCRKSLSVRMNISSVYGKRRLSKRVFLLWIQRRTNNDAIIIKIVIWHVTEWRYWVYRRSFPQSWK